MIRRGGAMVWIIVALAAVGSAAMLLVAVLTPVVPAPGPSSGGQAPVETPAARAAPPVRESLASLAALAEIKADDDPGQSLFRQTGKMRQLETRRWGRGGQITRWAVAVQSRPTASSPWSEGEAIIEMTVDDRGETVSTRTVAIKAADELELERAAGIR